MTALAAVRALIAEDEPEAATLRGHDGLRALLAQWLQAFDELHIDPKEFIDAGEAVVMPYQFRARERSSGSEISAPETWVFWLRDGMIIAVEITPSGLASTAGAVSARSTTVEANTRMTEDTARTTKRRRAIARVTNMQSSRCQSRW